MFLHLGDDLNYEFHNQIQEPYLMALHPTKSVVLTWPVLTPPPRSASNPVEPVLWSMSLDTSLSKMRMVEGGVQEEVVGK